MSKTDELVAAWMSATNDTVAARQALSQAETRTRNTANELGRHLTPDDARDGEAFYVWAPVAPNKEQLLEVKPRRNRGDHEVGLRGKPRPIQPGQGGGQRGGQGGNP